MQTILIIAGLTIVLLAIRYIIKKAVHSGVDAISNAITDKKNKDNPPQQENRADRYRGDSK